MPKLIDSPSIINAAGTKPKKIEEFVGFVNTQNENISVAKMTSPEGWEEPGQTPEFQEITVVLKGLLKVEHSDGYIEVKEGQAIITNPGEWIRYSTPMKVEQNILQSAYQLFLPILFIEIKNY